MRVDGVAAAHGRVPHVCAEERSPERMSCQIVAGGARRESCMVGRLYMAEVRRTVRITEAAAEAVSVRRAAAANAVNTDRRLMALHCCAECE